MQAGISRDSGPPFLKGLWTEGWENQWVNDAIYAAVQVGCPKRPPRLPLDAPLLFSPSYLCKIRLPASSFVSALDLRKMSKRILRLAFLHLAPLPGDLTHNRRLIETAITTAAGAGATWIITPELAVCGYTFADRIGTDWIVPQPDAWMMSLCRLAARYGVALFLSYPERDRRASTLYNSLFVIGPDGTIVGTHRKINTLRVGSESWSTPGKQATPVPIVPFDRVGLLICADAFSTRIAESLRVQGARILVSSAAWAPGLHGPNGEWERCTRKTGLPLFVCNRTGPDTTLNFTQAVSVVVKDGRRLLSLSSTRSTVFAINWNLDTEDMATPAYQRIEL